MNLVGAVGILCNHQGEVLLQRPVGRNVWGLPGGLCELGEAPEDTVKREIKEETALLVKEVVFLHLLTTPLKTLPNGDQAAFYTAIY